MTQQYTHAQLEAWAGLGPWRVGKSLGGGFPAITKDLRLGHNTHITGAVHGYLYHADQKANQAENAALIAAAPDLARLVLEKEKEIARLKAAAADLVSLCSADIKMNGTTYQPMPDRSAFTKAVERLIELINTEASQAREGNQ